MSTPENDPIRLAIKEIIQLVSLPQFTTMCNDIVELWVYSIPDNEDTVDERPGETVKNCGDKWDEAAKRGQRGMLDLQEAKEILKKLLEVVRLIQEKSGNQNKERLEYVAGFISGIQQKLNRWTEGVHPQSIFLFIFFEMYKYAPPELNVPEWSEETDEVQDTDEDNSEQHLPGLLHALECLGGDDCH